MTIVVLLMVQRWGLKDEAEYVDNSLPPIRNWEANRNQKKNPNADGPGCFIPHRPVFHGQSGEDRALFFHYFAKPLLCQGTFIELGAFDGLTYSNSLFFEETLGWSGVLIEAEPSNVERLMYNRPKAKNFAMAVCPDGQQEVTFIGGGAVGGIESHLSEQHKKAYISKNDVSITVPCAPMSTILREADIDRIDLFSLDVEGAELMVLQTMNWTIPVAVFVIEMGHGDQDFKVIKLLKEHGYKEADWNIMDHCPSNGDCAPNMVFENTNYPPSKQLV